MRFSQGFLLATVMGICGATPSYAQAISAGNISREMEKTLPSIEARPTPAPATEPAEKPQEPRRERPATGVVPGVPLQQELNKTFSRVLVSTSILEQEIQALFEDPSFDRSNITVNTLVGYRQKIWGMGVKSKRLLNVNFKAEKNPSNEKENWLVVEVQEIVIRKVLIEPQGEIRQSLLASIENEASIQFHQEKILDLDELEYNVKKRLKLGDVLLHASIVPVDPTQVDLKITVAPVPAPDPNGIVQIDNSGGWSFGRDRAIAGVALHGLFPGDRLDLMAMRAQDAGNGDFMNGMYFGRAQYNVPVGEWGVRLETWASGLHFHEVRHTKTKTDTNGEALEVGQGVIRPIYIDDRTFFDVRADLFMRYSIDRIWETIRTGEKAEYAGRIKASFARALEGGDIIQLEAGLTQGTVDLTPHKGAFAQDQLGPKANGVFTKVDASASLSGRFKQDSSADYRISFKGQWASKNLDSIEQFSLGGSSGLRAFASGEASGDMGVMMNVDIGHMFGKHIRPYMFYDVGAIWKNVDPWPGHSGPETYALQNAGLGLSLFFTPVEMNVNYAHQIGPNAGATSAGLDGDGTAQRYRVWASLLWRY